MGFTALVALGTGVVFGLSPALHATRLDVSNALKDASSGATSRSRLQRTFIVAQIGLTQPLLIGLVLVMGIARTEFGTALVDDPLADRVTRIAFNAGDSNVGAPNAKHVRIREVMDRVVRLPGVERVIPEAFGSYVRRLSRAGGGERQRPSCRRYRAYADRGRPAGLLRVRERSGGRPARPSARVDRPPGFPRGARRASTH